MSGLVGVTGATGALGGRVARRLAAGGVPQRLVVRDASRAPDLPGADVRVTGGYGDGEGMRRALDGVDVLLLVSAGEAEDRVEQHRSAVEAAAAAGVARVVYTSFQGAAPDCTFTFARTHAATEGFLAAAGLPTTSLRNSFYLDDFVQYGAEAGELRGPAGEGRVAAVTRDDCADTALAALLDASTAGRTLDVTGPAAFTLAELAAELTRARGREVRHVDETLEEAHASRASYDAPDWMVEGWISTYTAIARGENAAVATTVRDLTGREPEGVRAYLARTA